MSTHTQALLAWRMSSSVSARHSACPCHQPALMPGQETCMAEGKSPRGVEHFISPLLFVEVHGSSTQLQLLLIGRNWTVWFGGFVSLEGETTHEDDGTRRQEACLPYPYLCHLVTSCLSVFILEGIQAWSTFNDANLITNCFQDALACYSNRMSILLNRSS